MTYPKLSRPRAAQFFTNPLQDRFDQMEMGVEVSEPIQWEEWLFNAGIVVIGSLCLWLGVVVYDAAARLIAG